MPRWELVTRKITFGTSVKIHWTYSVLRFISHYRISTEALIRTRSCDGVGVSCRSGAAVPGSLCGSASLWSSTSLRLAPLRRAEPPSAYPEVPEQPEEPEAGERGYRFGDLFINKLTGKDSYKFGDLSSWFGGVLEKKACEITGKDDYQFGDVSRFVDSAIKEKVCEMTGKDSYQFGDITSEVARRIRDGEVNSEELSLLLRVLLSFGVGLTPVAHILPVKVLLDLLTWNLQAEIGNKASGALAGAVATELDERAKLALIGRKDYVLGDFTKEQLNKALSGITGKDRYEFGDITRSVIASVSGASETNSVITAVSDASETNSSRRESSSVAKTGS
ncbi:unnamed protein product [Polarella glacialis]|uniref:Uncharacterized protein n=1 Tax=Polarella glacialis TaxID=89957 RepID=A0A813GRG2_POLGL|nr:unnamed protein product [Polarella glacialis]CAE8666505.1 unnamed protein product [Polarella glacialis]